MLERCTSLAEHWAPTRGFIVGLITANAVLIGSTATLLGTGSALMVLTLGREPLPSPEFTAATMILSVTAAGLGAIPPGVIASLRDPLSELRVP